MSVDEILWVAMIDEPFIPKSEVNGDFTNKKTKGRIR